MTGVSLSCWTMSYFVAALVALLGGELLMAAGYGFPSAALRAPQTLVVVHLIAVGWLSLLMCGALLQFVPVLVARPLEATGLSLPALALLLAGLGVLLAGFLQLAGSLPPLAAALPAGAALLATGFGLVTWSLALTLIKARPLGLPARFVAVALVALAATVGLGAVFSVALSLPVSSELVLGIAAAGLPVHAAAGLGGWLTFAAMGVSYRLLAMFMLAPDLEGRRPRSVLWAGTAALTVLILGGLALALARADLTPALVAAALIGLVALGLYGADMLHLYRARKRRMIELNSQMAALALLSLAATAILALALAALGQLSDAIGAVVFLLVFGWLTSLGLAKLYKIVAFLTWLECYGPVLGRAPTPRVQDLVVEARARKWFLLHSVAAWTSTAALLAGSPAMFRTGAGAMALATAAIAIELVRIRRLSDVDGAMRLPAGARLPRLLVSLAGPR